MVVLVVIYPLKVIIQVIGANYRTRKLTPDNAAKHITPHTMRKTLASWQALQHAAGVELESNIEVRLIDQIKGLLIEEQTSNIL